MDRRSFLTGLAAVPLAGLAALPIPAAAEAVVEKPFLYLTPYQKDLLKQIKFCARYTMAMEPGLGKAGYHCLHDVTFLPPVVIQQATERSY